tara:strand:+ start:337 stop:591 length:255 start_codon:yes stop_codon:yes gene_type:complete
MQITAELSLYPLQEDYIPVINGFIERLAAADDLTLVTNAMSTQVSGEAEQVFTLIREALSASHAQFGKQVLVCKFIPGLLPIRD